MDPALIAAVAVVVIAAIVAGWALRRSSRRNRVTQAEAGPGAQTALDLRPEFPPEGLLVPEDVLRATDSTSAAIWDALEAAAAPVAVEYYRVSASDIAKLRTAPVNASVQQTMGRIVEAIGPKNPTVFRVVLPQGAELLKAVGSSALRGVASSSGKLTVHTVLKPVAAGGALAAGWPLLAVAGTVSAVNMVAQREQRAYQRRVEGLLGSHDERHYVERIKDQRSADDQLSRAISLMLDGHTPNLELALKSANDEFYRSQQFLERFRGVIDELADDDGRVDYRRLDEALGGTTKDADYFPRELHLARAAIALRRKAVIADAAARALADPTNPYAALRRFFDSQVQQLGDADALATDLSERLAEVELKGRWHDFGRSVEMRQERLRASLAPARIDGDTDIRYLLTPSGEIVQVLSGEDDQPATGVSRIGLVSDESRA